MGSQLPSPRKDAERPIFGPFVLSPNGWMHQDATWYGGVEVGLRPGDFMFYGDPATTRTEGTPTTTKFVAYVYCGQTAGWMNTPLGTEVDLGPGHIVLDGVPALRERGTAAPHLFGPCLLWPRTPISATTEQLELLFCLVPCGKLATRSVWVHVHRIVSYRSVEILSDAAQLCEKSHLKRFAVGK